MNKLDTARSLQQRLAAILDTVDREFAELTDEELRWKPAPSRWSIVECLQHLNLAERYYIYTVQHKVDRLGLVQTNPADQPLESNWVGRVMLWAIDPTMNVKLPAPGMLRPRRADELNPADVRASFVALQTLLRTLLDKAVYLDWNTEQVITMYGNWLKIRLGDTLLMLVAHTERHLNQALRVKEMMP